MTKLSTAARRAGLGLALSVAFGVGALAASAPRLAPGVVAAPNFLPPKATAYVTSIPTEIYTTTSFNQPATGERLRQGDPLQVLAEADEGRWVLVGRGGVGIGYVARSTICPVSLCKPGTGTATPPR